MKANPIALALAAIFLVAACQTTQTKTKLQLAAGVFATDQVRHAKETSGTYGDSQALIATADGKRAELYYAEANDNGVLNVPWSFYERDIKKWRWLKDKSMNLSAEQKFSTTIGDIPYVGMKLADRECIYIIHGMAKNFRDEYGRHTKALYGYFCEQPSVALSDQRIHEFLGNIKLETVVIKPNA